MSSTEAAHRYDGVVPTQTNHFVSRRSHFWAALFGAIALVCSAGCTTGSNAPEVREREAALVPPGLYQIAPHIAITLSPVHIEYKADHVEYSPESGSTGVLLPNGGVLTLAHAFVERIDLSKKSSMTSRRISAPNPNGGEPIEMEIGPIVYPFIVNRNPQFASVTAFKPADEPNGDWALLSFTRSQQPIRETADGALSPAIGFDGTKPIRRGTPIYCLGFPRTPGEAPGILGFARTMTIVQGRANRDFGPDEEIDAVSDTEIDMRGMSGGPVGTYDFLTGQFTVIGIVTRGSIGFKLFGQPFGRAHFVTSRIPPIALESLNTSESVTPSAEK